MCGGTLYTCTPVHMSVWILNHDRRLLIPIDIRVLRELVIVMSYRVM